MEKFTFSSVLSALKRALSITYLDKSDEDFVGLVIDPAVRTYKIKNRNGDSLHLSRSWVSKCLSGKPGFETHLQLKKASENYPDAIRKLYVDEFTFKSLKLVFNIEKLAVEKEYLIKVIKEDLSLYPGQKVYLTSIENIYEFFANILQLSMTIKPRTYFDFENKEETINECLDKLINYIIRLNADGKKNTKHNLPYSVEDKCKKNEINGKFREIIIKSFNDYYYDLDDYFENTINLDYAIYDKIGTFYNDTYKKVLDDLDIYIDDLNAILDNSALIFQSMNEKIQNTLFKERVLKSSYEDAKDYIMALSTYIFYKCKFLIPIEEENNVNQL